MKKALLFLALLTTLHQISYAQTDTTFLYFTSKWQETTRDSAFFFAKIYQQNNEWQRKDFWVKGNKLQMEGSSNDKDGKDRLGVWKWYNEDGSLDYDVKYEDGGVQTKTFYFKSGARKSYIKYGDNKVADQKGYDENGKEIKSYVVEREARFKGGIEGWKRFSEKHLNANVAANAGAPVGLHTVKLQFVVDKEGFVTNVKAIEVSAKCKPCAAEAVSTVSNGPRWEPAIQNNVNVIYQAIQMISFQVEETKKAKW